MLAGIEAAERGVAINRDLTPGSLTVKGDADILKQALLNMIHAAQHGTLVRWYDAGHALNAAAYVATFAWLASKLKP